ncbi:MAG: hypothetical protein HOB37_05490 [Rhodospirillaceae bacterium]|nr:hypothetical protein [Rhodospirillaceae bacterium]
MTEARRLLFTRTIRFLLKRFLDATLYPTPASLDVVGIENAKSVARVIRQCPERRRLAEACARPALELLRRDGLLTKSMETI